MTNKKEEYNDFRAQRNILLERTGMGSNPPLIIHIRSIKILWHTHTTAYLNKLYEN